MREAKHTPGPWLFRWEGEDREWAIVTSATGSIIVNVNTETGPDIHSVPAMRQMPAEANARLISYAPDLLGALELVVMWNAKRDRVTDELLPADKQDSEVAVAMRTIDRVRGRP